MYITAIEDICKYKYIYFALDTIHVLTCYYYFTSAQTRDWAGYTLKTNKQTKHRLKVIGSQF